MSSDKSLVFAFVVYSQSSENAVIQAFIKKTVPTEKGAALLPPLFALLLE